jgi:hypothetical protein
VDAGLIQWMLGFFSGYFSVEKNRADGADEEAMVCSCFATAKLTPANTTQILTIGPRYELRAPGDMLL